ncbi:uncharacterized protein G2W53_028189 [Senna tora]|uniref:Uncharacterized protein n=1 Tax=Senna tora TaxID=362788 RepID=A0A834W8I5_9FABA|nr:uncharacterized protein G2W53_028189 [Senna tora]
MMESNWVWNSPPIQRVWNSPNKLAQGATCKLNFGAFSLDCLKLETWVLIVLKLSPTVKVFVDLVAKEVFQHVMQVIPKSIKPLRHQTYLLGKEQLH